MKTNLVLTLVAALLTSQALASGASQTSGTVAIGTTVASGTPGSPLFVDGSGKLGQNNAKLFWDDANLRFAIGSNSPGAMLDITAGLVSRVLKTGTIDVSSGSNAVAGTGTLFTSEFVVGDVIYAGNTEAKTVASISSNTALTTSVNWSATQTGVPVSRDPDLLVVNNGNGMPVFGLFAGGRVGVGTTAPTGTLTVMGQGSPVVPLVVDAATTGHFIQDWQINGAMISRVDQYGKIVGGASFGGSSYGAISGTTNGTDPNILSGGFFQTTGASGYGPLILASGDDKVMRYDASGSILLVKAAASGNWAWTWPGDAGSAKGFLQTDGAGVSTWQQSASAMTPGSAAEIFTVTTVADVAGSLNNTYFVFYSANDATKYYAWFDDGVGVDPAVPGGIGIQVTYTIGDSDTTIATALQGAATVAVAGDLSISVVGAVVTFNAVTAYGTMTDVADGAAPTGFAFNVTQQGNNPSPSTTCAVAGEIRYDQHFEYMCVGVNTWKRSPLSAW